MDNTDTSSEALADGTPSEAFMVDYQDVSLKVIDATSQTHENEYTWFRGMTATSVHRDAMEEFLTGMAMPQMYRYERSMTSCHPDLYYLITELNLVTERLGPVYEGQLSLLPAGPAGTVGSRPGGSWGINVFGRHYHMEHDAMERVRTTSIGSCAAACGQSAAMTPDLQDLLNIHKEGGKCVAGASFTPIPPPATYDTNRGSVGFAIAQSRNRMPVLTAEQLTALQAVQPIHKQFVDGLCGSAPPLADPEVLHERHMDLDMTAQSESMHHFFLMKDHEFVADPLWDKEDACRFAILADRAHDRWIQAIIDGDWGVARESDNDHQAAHLCMGIDDANLQVRFSCGAPSGSCPLRSCADLLTDKFGSTPVYGTKL
jgi:hypothetical protein